MTTERDAALEFDPFEGDYGDGETRIINEIVDAPDPVRCNICAGPIKPGTKVRRIVETTADLEDMPAYGRDVLTAEDLAAYERGRSEHLICEACCAAARKDDADDSGEGERLERRYTVGFNRRAKAKA
ncbi:hypothetical protein [Azospirillum sp.]|uniref:hypothetical protein n=1 Tax=Azospirillum sp. TaxID=34012 RepID=UPI003D7479F6